MNTNTSVQFNQWLNEDIEVLDYSGREMSQFINDTEQAVREGLLSEFMESICAFPYPQSINQ